MDIALAHYNFKLKLNEMDSSTKLEFSPAEIDEYLNSALMYWVKQRDSGNNVLKQGAEMTQRRIDNLSPLLVDNELVAVLSSADNVYKFDLGALTQNYFRFMRASITIDECPDRIPVTDVARHGDLHHILSDNYRKPSIIWKRAVASFGRGTADAERHISIHSNGAYTVTGLYLDYYKLPVTVTIGGYNDINGAAKVKTQFDIPSEYVEEVVLLAVKIAAGHIQDPSTQLYAAEINLSE